MVFNFGLTKHRILKDILPHYIFEKLRNGDESPLYEMYRLYRDEFLAWSKKQFNTTDEQAKDAFQDAMLDFHQNVLTGRLTELTSSLKTYIFQIGKHKILNIQKKESRLTYHDALHMINNGEVDHFMEEENKAYTQEQISQGIEKLPEDCQKVLKLFYFSEYDMDSIARELNYKNADTAKSKKSLCMKNLMSELKKMSSILVF
jgi:RNA polymerase sigma factor (sigma-70 family)